MTGLARKNQEIGPMEKIFSYLDYRQYLKDLYEHLKKVDYHFSYASIAEQIGDISRAYLHRIFTGQQPLSRQTALELSKVFGLRKREIEYFLLLIAFDRSRRYNQKVAIFNRMLTYHKSDATTVLRENEFAYFSKWYHVAIRELLATVDFTGDYAQLGEMLDPPLNPKKVEQAIRVLLKLNMIEKNKKGRYVVKKRAQSTGHDEIVHKLAERRFQQETIALSHDAIENHPPEVRDISSITTSISADGFNKISEALRVCREQIWNIVNDDQKVDRVYQINVQIFPVSKLPNEGEKK